MSALERLKESLRAVPHLTLKTDEVLAPYTRFGIGGPAAIFCDVQEATSFVAAWQIVRSSGVPSMVIGGGTNLIVSDSGFEGVVLRFRGAKIEREGDVVSAEAGSMLQDVVDESISCGLLGMHTMTRIPGYLGGAVYGNAGAYGNSIHEVVEEVTFTDGEALRRFTNPECEFRYRESLFKRRKEWVILSARLRFRPGDSDVMKREADKIRAVRDAKYPPEMKCAGSIFKNIFFAHLPAHVQVQVPPKLIRDGKIPSAWFLEQAGVKGMRRGDIQVAEYHANLIYNDGKGCASDLLAVIEECKARVRQRFGFELEEEVQYVGFAPVSVP